MRRLLDTHVLIWAACEPERLSSEIKAVLADRRNDIFFSAVSVWEAAIKFALRRPDFRTRPEDLLQDAIEIGFTEIPVTSAAAARVATLPNHHRDPFDRLLVAQAIEAEALLLTADTALTAYAPHVLMLGPSPNRVS